MESDTIAQSEHGRNPTEREQESRAQLKLRGATEADAAFLWHLTSTTMRAYVEAVGSWDEETQRRRFHDAFDPARWQIVSVSGRAAGGLAVDRRPYGLFLDDIQILPPYQRRGIGSAIIRGLIAEARGRGVPLALNVLSSNPDARRLYERLGMVAVGPSLIPHCSLMLTPLLLDGGT